MTAIYLSHPYTGNEKDNLQSATQIAAELAKKYPHILFVNPLGAMHHTAIAGLDYPDVLDQCLTLLSFCTGIIMLKDWKNSKGCMKEYSYAKEHNIMIYETIEQFTSTQK